MTEPTKYLVRIMDVPCNFLAVAKHVFWKDGIVTFKHPDDTFTHFGTAQLLYIQDKETDWKYFHVGGEMPPNK